MENTKVNQPEERDADDLSQTLTLSQADEIANKKFKGNIKMSEGHQQCKEDAITSKGRKAEEIVIENRHKDSVGECILFIILFGN